MDISPAVYIGFAATVFGGAGLKVVESLLSKSKDKADDAREIRDELRLEISALREQVKENSATQDELEKEIESWRGKYYELFVEHARVQNELTNAIQQIKDYAERARKNAELAKETAVQATLDRNAVRSAETARSDAAKAEQSALDHRKGDAV